MANTIMSTKKEEIINSILQHIVSEGGSINDWYVGLSTNARIQLFETHKVNEQNGWWIYRRADSISDAKDILSQLTQKGVRHNNLFDQKDGEVVYAYKITASSKQ